MKYLTSLILLAASASVIAAPVYKCEKNGSPVYTNTPCPSGTGSKVELPELSITSGFKSQGSSAANNTSTPSATLPSSVQSKSSDGQRQRDSKRADILQDELRRESDALIKAEKSLAEQKEIRNGDEKNYQKVLDRLKPFEDEVALRKKNIEAIKKEIDTNR